MRLVFTVFGYEVWALEAQRQDPAEMLAAAIAELSGDEMYQSATEQHTIGAGETHNFDRDCNPPSPVGEEPWVDRFGFQ
jgi:hypothetical protein